MFLYFIDEYDICLLCVRSYYFIFLMLALCAKKKKKKNYIPGKYFLSKCGVSGKCNRHA